MDNATEDQKRRANEAVAATLGIYALTTRPDDPGAKFGYECALNAIVEADKRAAQGNPILAMADAARKIAPHIRALGRLETAS